VLSRHAIPLVAGFYYWLPHLSAARAFRHAGTLGFLAVFRWVSTWHFLLMHLTGLLGMPAPRCIPMMRNGWGCLTCLVRRRLLIMLFGVGGHHSGISRCISALAAKPPQSWNADTAGMADADASQRL